VPHAGHARGRAVKSRLYGDDAGRTGRQAEIAT
jgi:hypothetical protein